MIYVSSDLHGYDFDGFMALLQRAGFSREDDLYILGDVIDRNGDGGIRLLRWMAAQDNVHLILGNHEAMLLACRFVFDEVTQANLAALCTEKLAAFSAWMQNGAAPTLHALRALMKRDPGALCDLLDYIEDAPLYEMVEAGGRDFLLVHARLGNFDSAKRTYTQEELLFHRPAPHERYSSRFMTILGHTPTEFYGAQHQGRMYRTDTWIDIDTGAAHGGAPMLLRLDDLTPFYAD